jgi:hypothetical protein
MRYFLLLVLFCCFTACTTPDYHHHPRLCKAADYLWSQQGVDGGWHSSTHGIMRGGEAMTAYVLWTLLEIPDSVYPKPKKRVDKALTFLRRQIDRHGILGHADPDVLDYPNYATAYGLRILYRYGSSADQVRIQKMKTYLLSQQFTEKRGISPDHPAYGAWGFGEKHLAEGRHGHVDLSHTRRILQSLKNAEVTETAVFQHARNFLEEVQKVEQPGYDGGCYASSVTTGTNKGKTQTDSLQQRYYQSYATATCDGLLAYLASGLSIDAPAVQAAYRWLQKHPELEYPEGIPKDDPGQWHRVLFYYHLSVRAEAYSRLHHPGDWPADIRRLLRSRQQEDGHFANPFGAPNKEDDPLLATAMAIRALTFCTRPDGN